jgi:hypothetical protein
MSSTPPVAGRTVSSASSPEPSESAAADSDSLVTTDHPGIDKLLALLAYGEVAAFYRLTEEARMAPNLAGRINMASMAAAEMGHYDAGESTSSPQCRTMPRRWRTTTS